jgi:hypothetical protein
MNKGIDWLRIAEGFFIVLVFLVWDNSWITTAGLSATVVMLLVIDMLRPIILQRGRR